MRNAPPLVLREVVAAVVIVPQPGGGLASTARAQAGGSQFLEIPGLTVSFLQNCVSLYHLLVDNVKMKNRELRR
jgi:hypothetical protein